MESTGNSYSFLERVLKRFNRLEKSLAASTEGHTYTVICCGPETVLLAVLYL